MIEPNCKLDKKTYDEVSDCLKAHTAYAQPDGTVSVYLAHEVETPTPSDGEVWLKAACACLERGLTSGDTSRSANIVLSYYRDIKNANRKTASDNVLGVVP